MCKKKFLLLFALFLYWVISVSSVMADTSKSGMYHLAKQSRQRREQNLSENSNPLPQNLNEPEQTLLNPDNPWQSLRELINEGFLGLSESKESLNLLLMELSALKAETKEQRELYEESQKLLMLLKQSLEEAQNSVDIAIDRMQDAEDYALYIEAQNIFFKQQAEHYKKSALVGFGFGGVSFGVGVPLMVEGIRTDNRTMLWSGVGVIGVGSLLWVAGHYIFQWW